MDPDAARAAAEHRLGDLRNVRQECTHLLQAERRSAARSYFMKMSWLDFRLGFRMLLKYPGLTVVGGLALALAIAVGAAAFELSAQAINPSLPLPDGDRIVALRLWHVQANGIEEQALYDFVSWRGTLRSIDEVGAYRDVDRNLITPTGQPLPIRVAEITASAFRVARVRPLLGRTLDENDEEPGAPPVLVIGERVWRTQFAADPTVLGKTVRLGRLYSTIVGVLPEEYGFPVRHTAWAPLRIDAASVRPREGTAVKLFGRLARGASLVDAQTELTLRGQQASAELPATHEQLHPQVMMYARSVFPMSWSAVMTSTLLGQAGVVMFLILVCANVATLVFARTATRESELVVRTALGANRSRIVTQILAETLVLGGVAALIALSAVSFSLGAVERWLENGFPFPIWVSLELSPLTILYAVLLTMIAAVIMGVVPALKVTRRLADRLRQAAVGGADLKFGKVWTGLIVTQVALTIIFMSITVDAQQDGRRARAFEIGFPAEEFLETRFAIDRDAAAMEAFDLPYSDAELAHFETTFRELQQRLTADPAVSAVTYAVDFPGGDHARQRIEMDGAAGAAPDGGGHVVQKALVGTSFFDALDVRVLHGRGFRSADVPPDRPRATGAEVLGATVVVNESFVRQVFGGGNPVGRRVRYMCTGENCGLNAEDVVANTQSQWFEIVGVVEDIAMTGDPDLLERGLGGIYHAWQPGHTHSARIAVRVRGEPNDFAPRLRALVTALDPSVRVIDIDRMDRTYQAIMRPYIFAFRAALVASVIVLLLSVAGTYAIMSFTVARRTREIGIRTALGADPRRIVVAMFSRALLQVALGVVAGTSAMLFLMRGIQSARGALIVFVPVVIMLGVCMLACVVPTRRALRVQPTEALRQG